MSISKFTLTGPQGQVTVELDESGGLIVSGARRVSVKGCVQHTDQTQPPLECVVAVEQKVEGALYANLHFDGIPGGRALVGLRPYMMVTHVPGEGFAAVLADNVHHVHRVDLPAAVAPHAPAAVAA